MRGKLREARCWLSLLSSAVLQHLMQQRAQDMQEVALMALTQLRVKLSGHDREVVAGWAGQR